MGQVVSLDLYSGTLRTPLKSGHPWYNEQFWKSRLSFCSLQYLSKPWIADTPLLRITDSFHNPNCMQTILNDPDLADTLRTLIPVWFWPYRYLIKGLIPSGPSNCSGTQPLKCGLCDYLDKCTWSEVLCLYKLEQSTPWFTDTLISRKANSGCSVPNSGNAHLLLSQNCVPTRTQLGRFLRTAVVQMSLQPNNNNNNNKNNNNKNNNNKITTTTNIITTTTTYFWCYEVIILTSLSVSTPANMDDITYIPDRTRSIAPMIPTLKWNWNKEQFC